MIVDAASGTSGAGRQPSATTHHATVNENFVAYGLLDHRHTPEMDQAIGAEVLFTPHLAPMTRGILATCYARPTQRLSTEALLERARRASTPASRSSRSSGTRRRRGRPTPRTWRSLTARARCRAPATSSCSARSTTSPRAAPVRRSRRRTSRSASTRRRACPGWR